jgi:hypothetical protein
MSYHKGYIPWNKGIKTGPNPDHSMRMRGRTLTKKHRLKISKALTGRQVNESFRNKMQKIALERVKNGTHNFYKGDAIGYGAIHDWLRNKFGKSNHCENKKCESINPKMYVWAKLKNKKYERKRENFIQLCQSCHVKYDKNKLYIIYDDKKGY